MLIRSATNADGKAIKLIKPSLSTHTIHTRFILQTKGTVEFLVLEDNGILVGFVLLKWNGKKTHSNYPDVEDLYIKENYRSKGYGTLLLRECEKRAKEKGFTKIGLAVNPEKNTGVKKLYKKLGYKHDGKNTYLDGVYNGVEDWVIDMEKTL